MKEIFNHINNEYISENQLLKWINVTPSNIKVNEIEFLRELNGDIRSIETKTIFGGKANKGPWQKITLNDYAQIDKLAQLKFDGGKFVKEYDSYLTTKKQIFKDWNSMGVLLSSEERIYDGFENLVERKHISHKNNSEIQNKTDLIIQHLSQNATLIILDKQSTKIKYYHSGDSITKKIIYVNNKHEDSIETFEFKEDYSISQYSKRSKNQNNKSESEQILIYEYVDRMISKVWQRVEYKYTNSNDETIESYNRYEYNKDRLIIKEIFNNISYNNLEKVISNYSYNENSLINKVENQMVKSNMKYEYDENGNWVRKVKQTKNENSESIEETERIIEYK